MKNEVLNIVKALVENKQNQGFYPLHILDIELYACIKAMLELLNEDGLIIIGDTISNKYYQLPSTEQPPAVFVAPIASKIIVEKRDPFKYITRHRTPAPKPSKKAAKQQPAPMAKKASQSQPQTASSKLF